MTDLNFQIKEDMIGGPDNGSGTVKDFTDMTMPNLTGEKLAQQLMSIRADIPVILCTGFSEQISEEKAKKMGISEFIFKPLVLDKPARTVRAALDRG